MKKSIFLVLVIVFATTGCKDNETEVYTTLGEYTPFNDVHEKLNGKVEKVTEKYYWAIPDGDTFKKGNLITDYERDSIGWMNDWKCNFDDLGNMMYCNHLDENGKVLWKWEFFKEDNVIVSAKRTNSDTLSIYMNLKCNSDGVIVEATRFRAVVDTIYSSYTFTFSTNKDTLTYQNYNYRKEPTSKSIKVLDEYGQYLSVAHYNSEGIFTGGNDNIFNEKGNFIGWTFYDKDKNITSRWMLSDIEYDKKGNWVMGILKDNTGKNDIIAAVERTYTYYE